MHLRFKNLRFISKIIITIQAAKPQIFYKSLLKYERGLLLCITKQESGVVSYYYLSTRISHIFSLLQKIQKLRRSAEGVRVCEIVKIYVKFYITYSNIEFYIFLHNFKKINKTWKNQLNV